MQADQVTDRKLAGSFIAVSLVALFGGMTTGLFQGLEHAGVNLYPDLKPVIQSYYHGLSLHGVLNALVFTTFFICGFVPFVMEQALGRPLASRKLAWGTFWLMLGGLVLAAIPLVGNAASVLYTMYPPMQAHWAFYIGLTLVVVGTWLVTVNLVLTHRAWRRDHPGHKTPLPAFMCLATFFMWTIASMGLAVEMLALLIPWSLGLVEHTDALLARVLFWFTGHPIVYFWLLPAYISWYTMVPKQAGGKLFSDPMARVAFVLFLLLSTPTGFHHQFTDPGIHEGFKLVHMIFTFGVFFPSLLTFFNVVTSLEIAGKNRGGKGIFRWFFKLPWSDPSVSAQVLAMLIFVFGGIGGLINASMNLNLIVHNTAWIPGHLHLTVGTAVALTFIGICYWLVPYLAGRKLWSLRMAQVQVWTWFVGMIVFSNALHRLGLMGAPRRTTLGAVPYTQPEWASALVLVGVGGTVLFISGLLFFINMAATTWMSKRPSDVQVPFAEAVDTADEAPAILERWGLWVTSAVVLVVLAYGPPLVGMLSRLNLQSPGFRVW